MFAAMVFVVISKKKCLVILVFAYPIPNFKLTLN